MRTIYELGPFRLDTEARVLTHDGEATTLGARGVAVLAALVTRAGRYVEKSVIVEEAWPGVVVEDANLAVQISAIRRALARVPESKHWIETLTRRGYRFAGPVAPRPDPAETPSMDVGHPGVASARVASQHPNNVPARVSSFVGRAREIDEVKRLLARNRLVTLVGIGGVGKTRVALQVAGEVIERYPDGVWVVELASISDAALVPISVAQMLGVQEQIGEPLLRTVPSCKNSPPAARPRYLRARDRCRRTGGRRTARRSTERPCPRDQPRGAERRRRTAGSAAATLAAAWR